MSDQTLKTFLVTYRHDGAEWVLELKARDYADAKARLGKMAYATIEGEMMAKVPSALGPLAVTISAIRNGLARLARA